MKAKAETARSRAGGWRVAIGSSLLPLALACGSASNDKSAPETFDEYTEPLSNAVVGTPSGLTMIGPAADAGKGGSSGAVMSGSMVASGSVASGTVSMSGTIGTAGSVMASGAVASGTMVPSGASAGGTSGGFVGDGGPGTDAGAPGGFGFWHFDDCSPTSHFLADSSGAGANAQHALGAACVPGIRGLGVDFRSAKDVITVPDEPQFTVSSRVAVAAWVHPDVVTGDQPIVVKRLNDKTSFSLGIHKGNIEMSVVLTSGTTVISSAPIQAGAWSHVAGMFDGTFVYLFLNGQQFGQVFGAGTVRDVFGPVRIGATTQTQYVHGIVDEVFVSTEVVTAAQLEALACITSPSTVAVTPSSSPPVAFDSTFHFDVAATNNDIGFCGGGKQYDFFLQTFDPTLNLVTDQPSFFPNVTQGQTVHFGLDATPSETAFVGPHLLGFVVDAFTPFMPGKGGPPSFESIFGNATLNVAPPSGCFVFEGKELMITDTSVVDDPVRAPAPPSGGGGGGIGGGDAGPPPPPPFSGAASGSAASSGSATASGSVVVVPGGPGPIGMSGVGTSGSASGAASGGTSGASADGGAPAGTPGVWSFGNLMRNIAPSAAEAPVMTEQLFDNWLSDQTINGFTVSARPAMQTQVLDIWPRTPDGHLDLDQAPLRLQAIVNRVDLRNLANGSAGEGRFVFGVDDGFGNPQQFTVILEYNLPATTTADVQGWANAWHALSAHPFPSEEYNAALEAITHRFIDRNAAPGAVNGSALLALRTNEIALSFQWELREFVLSPSTNMLVETTIKETPDLGFNGTQTFADFANQNAAAIEAELPGANDNTVPATFEGNPFLAGSVFNNLVEWSAPGIVSEEARFHASLNTCNGCHGPETNTTFLMISPRFPGGQATLSPFLTGTTVTGQNGVPRTLNDLHRRQLDLESLVCGADAGM